MAYVGLSYTVLSYLSLPSKSTSPLFNHGNHYSPGEGHEMYSLHPYLFSLDSSPQLFIVCLPAHVCHLHTLSNGSTPRQARKVVQVSPKPLARSHDSASELESPSSKVVHDLGKGFFERKCGLDNVSRRKLCFSHVFPNELTNST
ncbi:hypothetical protein GQ44DRAFT_709417 [Phaeosphaeriaceae sp. PMI808]|nr:hypothetical protein GQ44DRAFT_709417 [Phaeosphaeriaceae sp. PMI808]